MPPEGGGDKGKLWMISHPEVQGLSSTEAQRVCLLSPQLFLSFVIFGGGKCDFNRDLSRLLKLQLTGKKGRWAQEQEQERNWRCNRSSVSQVLESHLNTSLEIRLLKERAGRKRPFAPSLSSPLLTLGPPHISSHLTSERGVQPCHLATKPPAGARRHTR